MPERDSGFAEIVGGHFDVYSVADVNANEVLAHFAGNVREHFVAVG